MIARRAVLTGGAAALGTGWVGARSQPASGSVRFRVECARCAKTELAIRELELGLRQLGLASQFSQSEAPNHAPALTIALSLDRRLASEAYQIRCEASEIRLIAGGKQGLLYAAFDFLERQGLQFGLDGTIVPVVLPAQWSVPNGREVWSEQPRFATRGLLPWPDFLNCISVFNQEDFHAYFAAMLRMRLNTFGMHVYTDAEQPTESYLSFDFAGAGHQAVLETSAMRGWGYLPQRTSTFGMGSAAYYDRESFGADAMRLAIDPWEIAERTTAMLRDGLTLARNLGIRTGIGFEPYKLPSAISDALPPEALTAPGGFAESRTARALLERRLGDLLERYPMVDHVWLWEDETSNWQSRSKDMRISTTAFADAHDFLRRHAPDKQLVAAGGGGFTRHFAGLHERLPGDVIFAALGDSLGWDPVAESYAKLDERQRWHIPWLEDDPSMWLPQFRASKVEADLNEASDYGCQGVMGIHWRQRIVDPTATFFAKAGWDRRLTSRSHYRRYARGVASASRSDALGALLDACDRGGALLSTYRGERDKQGHARYQEFAADYHEAFKYWQNEPPPGPIARQRATAARFAALADASPAGGERDNLSYLAGFVGFLVPYCDAYRNAHSLHQLLGRAGDMRLRGRMVEAQALVLKEALPLWLSLLPQVRAAVLKFQVIIATRGDLGQLASMQNKLVRLACHRLRLSLEEFVGPLPAEAVAQCEAALAPAVEQRRIFFPTRPSLLCGGETLRLYIEAPGHMPGDPLLFFSRVAGGTWDAVPARHEGRCVYAAQLGPFDPAAHIVEYRAASLPRTSAAAETISSPTHTAVLANLAPMRAGKVRA